jgi:hypothetical protein
MAFARNFAAEAPAIELLSVTTANSKTARKSRGTALSCRRA